MRGARWGYRMGNGELIDSLLAEGLTCAIKGCHMGNTAEEIVRRYDVARTDQDAFAAESQRRARQAIDGGAFTAEIVAVEIPQKKGPAIRMDTDEYPRAGTTAATLAALRPAFAKEGTVTAGNASGINDGAAALVVSTEERAAALDRRPLARILSYCTTGVDPMIMGMGPVEALKRAAQRASLSLEQLDLLELNEAFASQSLAVVRELKLDPSKVNVHGGAIALGHPLGATGTRLLLTLALELRRRGGTYGLATACIGGGQGIAMIVRDESR
jgi:acetyl-CoA C-acetyltransferase